jgi:hypothetical protein
MVTFNTDWKVDGGPGTGATGADSIANDAVITLEQPVYLLGLIFTGGAALNYTLNAAGSGRIYLNDLTLADTSNTRIKHDGPSNVVVNIPIEANFDAGTTTSYSATINIEQTGTGNLTFDGSIGGIGATVVVTNEGTGFVAFNSSNSGLANGFILNSGAIQAGHNAAFGTSGGALLRLRGGSLQATVGTSGDTERTLNNNYRLDALNPAGAATGTIGILAGLPLKITGHGAVASNTTLNLAAGARLTLGNATSGTNYLDAANGGATLTLTGGTGATVTLAANQIGVTGDTAGRGALSGLAGATGALVINSSVPNLEFTNGNTGGTSPRIDATVNITAGTATVATAGGVHGVA